MAQPLWKLPVGSQVKFGKYQVNTETPGAIVWTIVAKHHADYSDDSITLITPHTLGAMCFDAPEPLSPNRNQQTGGCSTYSESNIDQWLNSTGAANAWFHPQHQYDAPPLQYASRPGFLNLFTEKERAVIKDTTVQCRVFHHEPPYGSYYTNISRKVFLPSTAEVNNDSGEGRGWGYYCDTSSRQCDGREWWTRTPDKDMGVYIHYFDEKGKAYNYHSPSEDDVGVRPALNLLSSSMVTDSPDVDGCYTFDWDADPLPEPQFSPQPKPQPGQQRLCDLPVGATIKFGLYQVNTETPEPIIWSVAAKSHPGYPGNSVTLHPLSAIDIRCYDAQEPNNPAYIKTGNPTYAVSNIDQWLNSSAEAEKWYKPQHDLDAPPDTSAHTGNTNTQYEARPGFLNHFSPDERESILYTSIDSAGKHIDRRVFLPSSMEINNPYSGLEGLDWHFNSGDQNRCLTYQCYNNSLGGKPSSIHSSVPWWWRDGVALIKYPNHRDSDSGDVGVCPALNLPGDLRVPVEKSSDGSYYIVWDVAPTTPNSINVPTAIYGNRKTTIIWPESTDLDGDLAGYILQRSADSGDFTEIYKGADLTFTDTVTFGWKSVQYRVAAYDTVGWQSDWLTSETRTVVNNKPAVISGTDENLGTKSEGFTRSYTVTDPESDRVTVEERIDDVLIRSHTPTLGETNVFSVTEDAWLRLFNGTHTMTITAKDAIENITVITYTFTKAVDSFTIRNIMPLTADIRPTRMRLSVTREIPAGATFTAYLCNNGFDSDPTWEDATSAVTGHLIHIFVNTAKTAPAWGIGVKIEVARGTGEGACYVSQIDGNYE